MYLSVCIFYYLFSPFSCFACFTSLLNKMNYQSKTALWEAEIQIQALLSLSFPSTLWPPCLVKKRKKNCCLDQRKFSHRISLLTHIGFNFIYWLVLLLLPREGLDQILTAMSFVFHAPCEAFFADFILKCITVGTETLTNLAYSRAHRSIVCFSNGKPFTFLAHSCQ